MPLLLLPLSLPLCTAIAVTLVVILIVSQERLSLFLSSSARIRFAQTTRKVAPCFKNLRLEIEIEVFSLRETCLLGD